MIASKFMNAKTENTKICTVQSFGQKEWEFPENKAKIVGKPTVGGIKRDVMYFS